MSSTVEWTVHVCLTLACAPPGVSMQSGALAEFHGLPKPYLTKQLQALVRYGILRSAPGVRGGFSLARPSAEITLMDIVAAVEGRAELFQCAEIRKSGVIADSGLSNMNLPCIVQIEMSKAEMAWRKTLAAQTIEDLAKRLENGAPHVVDVTRKWIAAN
ncbi:MULTISPECIES: RrF2 family transcriptional regulator [unclassified Streptomyces]|uniref:RrF2 family transcriptional regulator n=1 Tax=unclassified Streptomyces TaxID=2593676 RepID=UPI0037ACD32D